MNISNFNVNDTATMVIEKFNELVNILNLKDINLANITGTIITTIIIVLTSVIVLWLLRAVGLYTIAKNKGDKYAFLAFVPYACLFVEGNIVGKTKIFGIEIEHPEILLPVLLISMWLPYTMVITSILFILFYFGILYRIYQEQTPNFAIILLILSIILPILQPFFIFFIRNSRQKEMKNS